MIVGNGLVVLCLMITGYTTELVTLFSSNRERVAVRVIWVCVLSVFVLDFAINAIQAAVRALIVDTLPAEKQESGNAWAGIRLLRRFLLRLCLIEYADNWKEG